MYLVIGEKPSVSQTLAKVLGAGKRQDGYLSGADCIVSWCLGHLAEYVSPEVYDSRYEKWEFSQLPILPEHWRLARPAGSMTVMVTSVLIQMIQSLIISIRHSTQLTSAIYNRPIADLAPFFLHRHPPGSLVILFHHNL